MRKFKRRDGVHINYLERGLTQIYCEEKNLKQRVYDRIAFFNDNQDKLVRTLDVAGYLGGCNGNEASAEDEIELYIKQMGVERYG